MIRTRIRTRFRTRIRTRIRTMIRITIRTRIRPGLGQYIRIRIKGVLYGKIVPQILTIYHKPSTPFLC